MASYTWKAEENEKEETKKEFEYNELKKEELEERIKLEIKLNILTTYKIVCMTAGMIIGIIALIYVMK